MVSWRKLGERIVHGSWARELSMGAGRENCPWELGERIVYGSWARELSMGAGRENCLWELGERIVHGSWRIVHGSWARELPMGARNKWKYGKKSSPYHVFTGVSEAIKKPHRPCFSDLHDVILQVPLCLCTCRGHSQGGLREATCDVVTSSRDSSLGSPFTRHIYSIHWSEYPHSRYALLSTPL
ncbi:hypothetical protein J6590_049547 [Homalodisca vitripennis]|nr:hypothetical protein J6590_049547 [Homalodisca vitripennis]